MLILIFVAITVIYYLIQKDKIRRSEKREDFKIRQEEKLAQLLKTQEKKTKENTIITIYK